MSMRVETRGDMEVVARFDAAPAGVHASIFRAMARLGIDLLGYVVENLSGSVLKRRTGNLVRAQVMKGPNVNGGRTDVAVGFNRQTAPYGVYHEKGVPHPWIIEAKRAKALKFQIGGKTFFRKRVMHPGLPERSFLRSALARIAPRVGPELTAAIAEGSK